MWQGIKNIYHFVVALFFNAYYGFPGSKLIVIGVTGTDGKTTTTSMIYEILKSAGKKVSMISSIQAVIGGKPYDTGFHVTTPDSHMLPKFLSKAVAKHDKYFVLEVSSHALDQNRTVGIPFAIGVLTTITHEHLDYHKTFTNYANAKFKLLRGASAAIVLPEGGIPKEVIRYADFDTGSKAIMSFGMTKGNLTQKDWELKLAIPGDFNILNGLAAASVGQYVGISKATIKRALANFKGIPGRFEEFPTNKDFRVIIDFAHKPNALEQALKTVQNQIVPRGKVIVMYGCASERDTLKRPMLGAISGRLADITVLTDEDPRWEDSMKIIEEIAKGCRDSDAIEVTTSAYKRGLVNKKHVFFKIPNRKNAIEFIIQKLAQKDDIILLCGKGHEKSMSYRGIEEPWSEHETVTQALKLKVKSEK